MPRSNQTTTLPDPFATPIADVLRLSEAEVARQSSDFRSRVWLRYFKWRDEALGRTPTEADEQVEAYAEFVKLFERLATLQGSQESDRTIADVMEGFEASLDLGDGREHYAAPEELEACKAERWQELQVALGRLAANHPDRPIGVVELLDEIARRRRERGNLRPFGMHPALAQFSDGGPQ